jgi:alcohol dehydrogenase, propanol-preferring
VLLRTTRLIEVVALAQAGKIQLHVEAFPLGDALAVYQRLRDGRIAGRTRYDARVRR